MSENQYKGLVQEGDCFQRRVLTKLRLNSE